MPDKLDPQSIESLRLGLEQMAQGVLVLNRAFGQLTGSGDAASVTLEDLGKATKIGENLSWKYSLAVSKMVDALRDVQHSAGKSTAVLNQATAEYKKAGNAALGLQEKLEEERQIRQLIDFQLKSNAKHYITLGEAINKSKSSLKNWAGYLGAGTYGVAHAKDLLLKYNESMFRFSRAQQVAGRGMGDLETAFKTISRSTTMSKVQFADFINIAASGWKGITPTADVLARLGANLQNQFGPNVQRTTEALKDFLALQDKFPAMAKVIENAMEAISTGKADEKTLKQTRAQIAMMRASGRISKEQASSYLQMTTKTTDAQNQQVKSNKAIYEVSQKAEDAQLAAAKVMEGAAIAMAESLSTVISQLERMPYLIVATSAAWSLMNKQVLASSMGLPLMGFKGIGSNLGLGAGAAIAGGGTGLRLGAGAGAGAMGRLKAGWGSGSGARNVRGSGTGAMALFAGGIAGTEEYQKGKERKYGAGRSATAGVVTGALTTGGTWGGAVLGTKIGAAIGTAIAPGVGTAIGAAIGGIAGAIGGGYAGKKAGNIAAGKLIIPEKDIKKANEELQKQIDIVGQIAEAYQANLTNFEYATELNLKAVELFKEQISLLSEMGQILPGQAPSLFEKSIEDLRRVAKESQDFTKTFFDKEGFGKILREMGVEFSSGVEDAFRSGKTTEALQQVIRDSSKTLKKASTEQMAASGRLSAAQAMSEGPAKEKAITDALNDQAVAQTKISSLQLGMGTVQGQLLVGQRAITEAVRLTEHSWKVFADEAEKYNGIVEQRLQVERELMESAQFGMGASISMMQKQVDLAYQMMKVQQTVIKQSDDYVQSLLQRAKYSKSESSAIKDQVKGAKNFMEAQQIINHYSRGHVETAQTLTRYYLIQQEATMKIMQQQKKIYDLTKDIREGYLQAITAMSIGAGEFGKIIGTQEMGVTQLMDAVNAATQTGEKNILNTIGIGGQMPISEVQAGVRTQYAAEYRGQGSMLSVLPGRGIGDTEEARNRNIRGWKEAKQKYKEMQFGEGEAPEVGTGMGGERYLDATIEGVQDGSYEGTYRGTKEAIIEVSKLSSRGGYFGGSQDIMSPINQGLLNRSLYDSNERQNPANVTKWAAGLMSGIPPPPIADPSRLTTAPGPLPFPILPGEAPEETRQEYISAMEKALERNAKDIMTSNNLSRIVQKNILNVTKSEKVKIDDIKKILIESRVYDEGVANSLFRMSKAYTALETVRRATETGEEGFDIQTDAYTAHYGHAEFLAAERMKGTAGPSIEKTRAEQTKQTEKSEIEARKEKIAKRRAEIAGYRPSSIAGGMAKNIGAGDAIKMGLGTMALSLGRGKAPPINVADLMTRTVKGKIPFPTAGALPKKAIVGKVAAGIALVLEAIDAAKIVASKKQRAAAEKEAESGSYLRQAAWGATHAVKASVGLGHMIGEIGLFGQRKRESDIADARRTEQEISWARARGRKIKAERDKKEEDTRSVQEAEAKSKEEQGENQVRQQTQKRQEMQDAAERLYQKNLKEEKEEFERGMTGIQDEGEENKGNVRYVIGNPADSAKKARKKTETEMTKQFGEDFKPKELPSLLKEREQRKTVERESRLLRIGRDPAQREHVKKLIDTAYKATSYGTKSEKQEAEIRKQIEGKIAKGTIEGRVAYTDDKKEDLVKREMERWRIQQVQQELKELYGEKYDFTEEEIKGIRKGKFATGTPGGAPGAPGKKESEEVRMQRAAQNLRNMLPEYKGSKKDKDYTRKKQDFLYKQAIGQFAREADWEKLSPEEINKQERLAQMASQMGKAKNLGLDKSTLQELVMEDIGGAGRFQSEGQRKRTEASAAEQAAFQSQETTAQLETTFGAGAGKGGGSAGGIYGEIVVNLSSELEGRIVNMENILMKIEQGYAVKD